MANRVVFSKVGKWATGTFSKEAAKELGQRAVEYGLGKLQEIEFPKFPWPFPPRSPPSLPSPSSPPPPLASPPSSPTTPPSSPPTVPHVSPIVAWPEILEWPEVNSDTESWPEEDGSDTAADPIKPGLSMNVCRMILFVMCFAYFMERALGLEEGQDILSGKFHHEVALTLAPELQELGLKFQIADMKLLLDGIAALKPTVSCAVPCVLDRIYSGLQVKLRVGGLLMELGGKSQQKFALRFSTPSEAENFITLMEDILSGEFQTEMSAVINSPTSSQSEFIPPYRPDTSSMIMTPIYASSETTDFHYEDQQDCQFQTQDIVADTEINGVLFPPCITSLLSSCSTEPEGPEQSEVDLALVPELQEYDLKSEMAKYMQDASFLGELALTLVPELQERDLKSQIAADDTQYELVKKDKTDICTIMYTSETTGDANEGITTMIAGVLSLLENAKEKDKLLLNDIAVLKPTVFCAVPCVLDRIYSGNSII